MDGKQYRMDFEMTPITSGLLFHGTVFQNHIFEFFFVEFKNGEPTLFSPLSSPPDKINSVLNAIKEYEKLSGKK